MSTRIHPFHGGLVLEGRKAPSTRAPLAAVPLPERLLVPLQQHIGAAAEPVVEPGRRVLKGEPLARAVGYVSAPVHAPTSGTVVAVEPHPVPHPSGLSAPCVVIEPDGEERWHEACRGTADWHALAPEALRARVRAAGIVGMGGAGFPTHVKLNPGPGRAVHTLVLNGVECEPYITCDDMLMRTRAEAVLEGARIMQRILGARRVLVGVEEDKPEALAALRAAAGGDPDLEVVAVPARYPSGGERQLIRLLTGLEVPSEGLPADVGIVCQNVGTAAAVRDAVVEGRPLISRIVTVTGGGVCAPRNLEVPVGTPLAHAIAQAGGYTGEAARLIVGGPMMGFAVRSDAVPVTKTVNCLLVAARGEVEPARDPRPCVRCGACAEVCPARLLPQQLYWYARAKDLDRVQDFKLFDCIECGCCALVCPSQLPLVDYYRYAKSEIWALERERERAARAKRRHEAHLARLERERAEREARSRARRRRATDREARRAAVTEALERARARRTAQAENGRTEGDGAEDA